MGAVLVFQEKKENQQLPVAIIGGGPVGLAAAAHLMKKGERFVLFESGQQVGANIKKWGHVRLFSPWRYNIDKVAKELLTSQGWEVPDEEGLPTGNELVEKYLYPLSKLPAIRDHIHVGAKVVSVTRKGLSKIKTKGRESLPFVLQVEIGGETNRFEAKAVIDASGTWSNPNPSVSDGVWGKGELDAKSRIFYGIPNILGAEKNRYIGKNVVVVGGGHSAINVLLELRSLKQENPETNIFWVLRKNHVREVYGGQENDNLPARGELGIQIQGMVDAQEVSVLTPFFIEDFRMENGRLTVTGELNGESMEISNIDQVISNTGTRPELSFLHEVRINMDSVIESVAEIAPLIDPNIHSCGTVRPHGEKELRQPEKKLLYCWNEELWPCPYIPFSNWL